MIKLANFSVSVMSGRYLL